MLPQKALLPDFEEDIFITYAHADNVSLLEDFKGFVDRVHERLRVRLKQLIGEEPKIWRDLQLEGTEPLTQTLVVRLSKTAFLVCILSPSYLNSHWCRMELNEFYQWASKDKGIKINNRSRIFKVVKTPIGYDPTVDPLANSGLSKEVRTVLRESLGYEFYEFDKLSGRLREFSGEYSDEYEKKHLQKIEDLAQDIMRFINDPTLNKAIDKCVYLAETTPELTEERDDIRRNLLMHGYNVFPDEDLPFESVAFDKKVSESLERCILSIHLVGSDFTTMQPENEKEEKARKELDAHYQQSAARVRRQHDLAMIRGEDDTSYSRLIWMPAGLSLREPGNQNYVAYLKNDPAVHERAEILSTSKLEDLKTIIQKRLNITWDKGSAKTQKKRVYLICDKPDKEAAIPLKDFLQEHNCEVLSPFDPETGSHAENVRWCDAILIFYDNSDTMEYKLTQLKRVNGLRDQRPLLARGIYVGGAETEHKQIFNTDEALLMKCFGDFSPDAIKPFLDQLETNCVA